MKGNLYCSSCGKLRPNDMFWSVQLRRHVAHCSFCRSDTLVTEAHREHANIYLCKTLGLAACIKFVVDQLPKRYQTHEDRSR